MKKTWIILGVLFGIAAVAYCVTFAEVHDYQAPYPRPGSIAQTATLGLFAGPYTNCAITSETAVTLTGIDDVTMTYDDASTATLVVMDVMIQSDVDVYWTAGCDDAPTSVSRGMLLEDKEILRLTGNQARWFRARATSTTGVLHWQWFGWPREYEAGKAAQ